MNSKEYEIRLFDAALTRFALSEGPLGSRRYELVGLNESLRHLMPFDLIRGASSERIESWLKMRSIPKHRAFAKELLAQIGLHPEDAGYYQGVVDCSRGLSVNDSYWVVEADFDGTWEGCNLYDNGPDEGLAPTAFAGRLPAEGHRAGPSPEWSTGGTYPKAWRRAGGDLVLYKAGSDEGGGTGNEPYSEWFAQQVAEAMGIPHVEYGLEIWEGRLASTCHLANTEDVSFVSWRQATGASKFPQSLAAACLMGPDILEAFEDMAVFDCLVMNADRHSTNFALARDNGTGQVLGLAPLFDHNLSLFPEDMPPDFPDWEKRGASWLPGWADIPYDRVLSVVLADRHREGLRRLLDFSFEQHPIHRVPDERLRALDRLVRSRAKRALEVPVLSRRDREQLLEPIMAGLSDMPLLYDGGSLLRSIMSSRDLQKMLAGDRAGARSGATSRLGGEGTMSPEIASKGGATPPIRSEGSCKSDRSSRWLDDFCAIGKASE